MIRLNRIDCLVLAGVALCLSACATTTIWSSVSTMDARRTYAKDSGGFGGSSYALRSDWHVHDWVIQRGATFTFRPDGTGSFTGRVYTKRGAKKQELRLQAIAHGKNGRLLFAAPGADLGYAIHAPTPMRDYPVDFNFGYDQRQYPFLDRITFAARVRSVIPTSTAARRKAEAQASAPAAYLPPAP
jgi:hypothetical protein